MSGRSRPACQALSELLQLTGTETYGVHTACCCVYNIYIYMYIYLYIYIYLFTMVTQLSIYSIFEPLCIRLVLKENKYQIYKVISTIYVIVFWWIKYGNFVLCSIQQLPNKFRFVLWLVVFPPSYITCMYTYTYIAYIYVYIYIRLTNGRISPNTHKKCPVAIVATFGALYMSSWSDINLILVTVALYVT